MSISQPALLVNAAINLATQSDLSLYQRWINLSLCGHRELLFNQSDSLIDLLLRSIETETARRLQQEPAAIDHHLSLQMALSKSWIFSWYEVVRCIQERSNKIAREPALNSLRRKLELVRVPLAKMQIANDGSIETPLQLMKVGNGPRDVSEYSHKNRCEYTPVLLIRTDTGSAAWSVYDTKTKAMEEVARRELSDDILNLWGRASAAT